MASTVPVIFSVAFDSELTVLPSSPHEENSPRTAFGEVDYGINVNAIAPGWFLTKMSAGLIEQFEDQMLADTPFNRFGESDDIEGVVLFLASSAAAYMTGQTIVVDGGQTAKA